MRGAALLAAASLLAGAPAPPAPAPASKPLVLTDPPCTDPDRASSDCREVRIETTAAGLAFDVRLGAPLAQGMFTCVHVGVDADDDPSTGIGGEDLRFRAALGSRFHPNDWTPDAPGIPAPLENRLLSRSAIVTQETAGSKEVGRTWQLDAVPGAPEVEGDRIRFTLPAALLSRGTEWIGAEVALRIEVETWCGDQPLLVDLLAADEGLPIAVDGDGREWSGTEPDRDPGGELHRTLRHLDLLSLRADHDAKRLLVLAEFEREGFAARPAPDPDVTRSETIVLLAEPVDSSYESPRRLVIPRGQIVGTVPDGTWALRGRTVEAALPRTGLDSRARVLAWTEARFSDFVPSRGTVKVPRRAK